MCFGVVGIDIRLEMHCEVLLLISNHCVTAL